MEKFKYFTILLLCQISFGSNDFDFKQYKIDAKNKNKMCKLGCDFSLEKLIDDIARYERKQPNIYKPSYLLSKVRMIYHACQRTCNEK